jgi:hypothetical protein
MRNLDLQLEENSGINIIPKCNNKHKCDMANKSWIRLKKDEFDFFFEDNTNKENLLKY